MTFEDLRAVARRDPFESFIICMNDGSRLKVTAPDNFVVSAERKFDAIVLLEGDRFAMISIRNIAYLTTRGTWPRVTRKRKNDSAGDEE